MKSKGLGLKIVIGLMLLVLILFISSTVFAAKASYTNEININRPIAIVFNKLSDSNYLPQWNPIAKTVTVDKETPEIVGSTYIIKANQMDKGFQVTQTIKEYTPNSDFADELDVENMIVQNQYHLERTPSNGTKLTKKTTIIGKGHFIRWVTRIYKGKFKTAEQKTLTLFKTAVEK